MEFNGIAIARCFRAPKKRLRRRDQIGFAGDKIAGARAQMPFPGVRYSDSNRIEPTPPWISR